MKLIFGSLLIFCCLQNCEKHSNHIDLDLEEILKFVPDEYDDWYKIVYNDAESNTKTLSIDRLGIVSDKTIGSTVYHFNNLRYTFRDDSALMMVEVNKSIRAIDEFSHLIAPTIFTYGKEQFNVSLWVHFREDTLSSSNILEEVIYNGKVFNNVHERSVDLPHYGLISYNAEFGIVAFKDENNTLWSFDRFEK